MGARSAGVLNGRVAHVAILAARASSRRQRVNVLAYRCPTDSRADERMQRCRTPRLGQVDSRGRTVTLRPLLLQDAEVMAAWGDDPQFCLEADWTVDLSFHERHRFQRGLIEAPPPGLIRFGATLGDHLVGYVDLHGREPDRRELGVVIGERARWGSGLGGMAAAAGLDHGFGPLGLQSVWAEALDANQRSVHILRRLGMVETGLGEQGTFRGQPSQYRRFSISSEGWTRNRTD